MSICWWPNVLPGKLWQKKEISCYLQNLEAKNIVSKWAKSALCSLTSEYWVCNKNLNEECFETFKQRVCDVNVARINALNPQWRKVKQMSPDCCFCHIAHWATLSDSGDTEKLSTSLCSSAVAGLRSTSKLGFHFWRKLSDQLFCWYCTIGCTNDATAGWNIIQQLPYHRCTHSLTKNQ